MWVGGFALFAVLLATWSLGGHARSMRWPALGVALDVVHHGAAALWLGGLAAVSQLALRSKRTEQVIESVQRFSRLATVCVAALVATGVAQTVRLTGSPVNLFSGGHGRFILLKVALLGIVLRIAAINRGRVIRRFARIETVSPGITWALRRAMGTEFALGIAVLAITAALVVTPPRISNDRNPATTPASAADFRETGGGRSPTAPFMAPTPGAGVGRDFMDRSRGTGPTTLRRRPQPRHSSGRGSPGLCEACVPSARMQATRSRGLSSIRWETTGEHDSQAEEAASTTNTTATAPRTAPIAAT